MRTESQFLQLDPDRLTEQPQLAVLEILHKAVHVAWLAMNEAHRELESHEAVESPRHTPEEAYASAIFHCLNTLNELLFCYRARLDKAYLCRGGARPEATF